MQEKKTEPPHRGEVIAELYQAGLELKRCQLKRTYPHASPDEIEAHLWAWQMRIPEDLEELGTLTVFPLPPLSEQSSTRSTSASSAPV